MNEFDNLIEKIAREWKIKKSQDEDNNFWRARIIYSLMGQTGLSSLRDVLEEDGSISITHFKCRMKKIYDAFFDFFPDLVEIITDSVEDLEEEIYRLYLKNGYLYHTPNRLLPCSEKRAECFHISFVRGAQWNENISISGLGTYIKNESDIYETRELCSMFHIDSQSLKEFWSALLKRVQWHTLQNESQAEYLRVKPPFSRGYWKNAPDKKHDISVLRMGDKRNRRYYLYRYADNEVSVSVLPEWMVEGKKYRKVSNALLASRNVLPKIKVEERDVYVIIDFQYLPAEDIHDFIRLYSWPMEFCDISNDFRKRIVSKEIWKPMKSMLEELGYEVEE
ncbi:MAG: hypothetical protein ACI4HI_03125 [Lachnospiraceae bacterium]